MERWRSTLKRHRIAPPPASIRFTPPLRGRPPIRSKRPSVWRNFLKDLCSNASLHGLPHIANQQRAICERVVWSVVVLSASLATAVTSYNSWLAYRHPTITTTVVTTQNDCSNFPFPSFTICDSSRVDWERALNLTQADLLPSGQNVSMDNVLMLLKSLADITFGDFDLMDNLASQNIKSKHFGNLNIAELLRKVQRPCSEMFYGLCWWRGNNYDCCSIFDLQRTDLGYCYSFNHDLSEKSQEYAKGYGRLGRPNYWVDWNGEVRPRRASISGPWNGLRMTVHAMNPEQFYLEEPRSFPNSENQRIDPATFVEVRVYSIILESTERVRHVDFEDRGCLFLDERDGWNNVYTKQNCLAQCDRSYCKEKCGCSPHFLFIDDNATQYPHCNVKGLNCLKKNNLLFNDKAPHAAPSEFFQYNHETMLCDCPPDCNSLQYMFDTSITNTLNQSHIGFDLHYRGQYNILYKADVMYGFMEFLVAIGGLAGFFLGGSLLSGVELVYFFTFRIFYHWKQARNLNRIPHCIINVEQKKY